MTSRPGPGVTSMTMPAAVTRPPTSPTPSSTVLRRMKRRMAHTFTTRPCFHGRDVYGVRFGPGSGVTPAAASVASSSAEIPGADATTDAVDGGPPS